MSQLAGRKKNESSNMSTLIIFIIPVDLEKIVEYPLR